MKKQVVILAGGLGTRLRKRLKNLPKPMVPILGKPALYYQIQLCIRHKFTNIILLVRHRNKKIKEYFGDGSAFGVSIKYIIDNNYYGTYGALYNALPNLEKKFFVFYGDTFLDINLSNMWSAHNSHKADCTIFVHPNDHPHDSDLVESDTKGFIKKIYHRSANNKVRNLVNAGLYIINKAKIQSFKPPKENSDIAKDIFPQMIDDGIKIFGYKTCEYIKDIGTPERLDLLNKDINAGLVDNLSSRKMRGAVFLDRDGTLNYELDHIKSPSKIKLYNRASKAIRNLNKHGKLAIVVTNQPVVARGDISLEKLNQIHARLEMLLGKDGAYLDHIYFCPHHPESGFPNEITKLKRSCNCRKPRTGLLLKACKRYNIDKSKSWMIGDTTTDIKLGLNFGLRTILVRTGYAGLDFRYSVKPDYVCADLFDGLEWILNDHDNLTKKLDLIFSKININKRVIVVSGKEQVGKSFTAQVLKELLQSKGKEAHIISLDSWKNHKFKSKKFFSLNYMPSIFLWIKKIINSKKKEFIIEPLNTFTKKIKNQPIFNHLIKPKDIIIFDGLPALQSKIFYKNDCIMKIFVELDENTRKKRLKKKFLRTRGKKYKYQSPINSNLSLVELSRSNSDVVIDFRNNCNF